MKRRTKKNEKKIIIDQATFNVAFLLGRRERSDVDDDVGIQLQTSLHTNIFRVLTLCRPKRTRQRMPSSSTWHKMTSSDSQKERKRMCKTTVAFEFWINHLCRGEEWTVSKKKSASANTKSHKYFCVASFPWSIIQNTVSTLNGAWFFSTPSSSLFPLFLFYWKLSKCSNINGDRQSLRILRWLPCLARGKQSKRENEPIWPDGMCKRQDFKGKYKIISTNSDNCSERYADNPKQVHICANTLLEIDPDNVLRFSYFWGA